MQYLILISQQKFRRRLHYSVLSSHFNVTASFMYDVLIVYNCDARLRENIGGRLFSFVIRERFLKFEATHSKRWGNFMEKRWKRARFWCTNRRFILWMKFILPRENFTKKLNEDWKIWKKKLFRKISEFMTTYILIKHHENEK